MKKIIVILVCLVFMSAFAIPVFAAIDLCPLPGQLGYWKLDDGSGATTATDSADALPGTITGATSTIGQVNGAFDFVDTELDEIDMGNVLNFDTGSGASQPFSGEAWIKTSTTGHYQYIMSKMVYGGAMTGWGFYVRTNKLAFMLSHSYAAGRYVAVYGGPTITDDHWHHVAFTYDGRVWGHLSGFSSSWHTGIELYVDGVQQTPTIIHNYMWYYLAKDTIKNDRNFQIGGVDASSWYEHFDGTIDEVAVYDRILTPTEISQHYQNGLAGYGYCEVLVPMDSFVIDHAKLDFKKNPNDDKVHVKGTLALDLVSGDNATISEDVTVTVGPLSQTINMEEKGKQGEKWEYKRPKDDGDIIKHMTIDWKNGKFDFSMDKVDLSGLTDPDQVTISIQIGDDYGYEIITMTETKHWDYKGP